MTFTPATTGTIVMGNTAGTGAITLGSSTAAQTTNIATGTGVATVNIGTGSTTNANLVQLGSTNSQVGIGAAPTNASAALQIISTTKGFLPPVMTAANRGALTSPANGLVVFDSTNNALVVNTGTSAAPIWTTSVSGFTIGDIKTGLQAADHSGWILLNGRAKTTLTATQQTVATSLGIGANLPNASNTFLVQNGGTLGAVSGSNTKTIARSDLPNVNITTSNDGGHTHNTPLRGGATIASNDTSDRPPRSYGGSVDSTTFSTAAAGAHTHTVSLNGGVTQTTLDITPRSLSVNMFIYLGI
jgi:hypothetical protein